MIDNYRAGPVTHPDITLNVEGRGPSEPEGLHVGVDDCLVHGVPLCPGTLELGYQLVIHGTPRNEGEIFLLIQSL